MGSKSGKSNHIMISWWNGGGKVVARLKVNPVLNQYLKTKPDIFAYGEALVSQDTKEMKLEGYNTIIHKAKIKLIKNFLPHFSVLL